MTSEQVRARLAVGLAVVLAAAPAFTLGAENASLGTLVPQGEAELNGTWLKVETTVYAGDRVRTPADGAAAVLLPGGSQFHLAPASVVEVDARGAADVLAALEQGALVARSMPERQVAVWAADLLMRPVDSPGLFQVELVEGGVLVVARRGAVEVEGANRTVTVPAGQAMRFEVAQEASDEAGKRPQGPHAQAGLSGGQKAAIVIAVAAGVATAIAVPLALNDGGEEVVVSPATP
ncbi:MAG: hypothetical protein ACE5G6_09440 [Terriglobia bacterium]